LLLGCVSSLWAQEPPAGLAGTPCGGCVAGELACNGSLQAVLPAEGALCTRPGGQSQALYRFEVLETAVVDLSLESTAFDAYLSLLDGACAELATNDDCPGRGLNSCIEGLQLQAGVYFAAVSSFSPEEGGAFTLSLACTDVSACRECLAGTLTCGVPLAGTLDANDCALDGLGRAELYELDLRLLSTVRLNLESTELALGLSLLDSSCREVVSSAGGCAGAETCLMGVQLAAGRYYVRVSGDPPAGAEFSIFAECQPFNPCRDCQAAPAVCGGEVQGELKDRCTLGGGEPFALHALRLDRGLRVRAALAAPGMEAEVLLVDASCRILAQSESCGDLVSDACLEIDLPPGDYAIGASALEGQSGHYTLRVDCSEVPTCRDCRAGSVSCNQTLVADLALGDCEQLDGRFIDVWELQLFADGEVQIDLRSADFDTVVALLDASCLAVAENDDCSPQSIDHSCLTVPLAAGTYSIAVTSFGPGEDGAYRLEVRAPQCNPCVDCEVGVLECGTPVDATFPKSGCSLARGRSVDFYAFTLEEAQEVAVALDAERFDAVLALLGPDCLTLFENDDCHGGTVNSCLLASLEPGTYHVAVSGRFPDEGGPYRLLVDCAGGGLQRRGDSNQDGRLDISDAVSLLGYLFLGSPAALPCGDGSARDAANLELLDIDGGGRLDLGDPVALLGFLFRGVEVPRLGRGCEGIQGCPEACRGG
jgi:hypothetical protein